MLIFLQLLLTHLFTLQNIVNLTNIGCIYEVLFRIIKIKDKELLLNFFIRTTLF